MSGEPQSYTPPNPLNYQIGKGVLSIAPWTGVASPAYVDVGNAPSVSFELTEQSIEHFSSRVGLQEQDAETVIQTGYTLSFTLDEISIENMRMFLKATLSGKTILQTNTAVNGYYCIKFKAANPVGPNIDYEFWKVKLTPGGAFSLIGQEYTTMSFTGKGMSDRATHSTSPFFTATYGTTTTTTTSST